MNFIALKAIIKETRMKLFSAHELQMLLKVSPSALNRLVWSYVKKGFLVKLKNNLYCLAENPPSPYCIANKLYSPSYISFDTALSFYGIIPETIYTLTSATAKTTRKFEAAGIAYHYFHIKKEAYTGYIPLKHDENIVHMAEPEKALADYLYFVDLKKRNLQYERINLKKIKRAKLINYLKLFKRPKTLKLMKQIYADQRKFTRIY